MSGCSTPEARLAVKKAGLTGSWGLKPPFIFLAVYFFVVLPISHFFSLHTRWTPEFGYDLFLFAALFYLLAVKSVPLRDLGVSFRHCGQNILIGGLSGGMVLLALPLLDKFVDVSGLAQTELFAEAAARSLENAGGNQTLWLPLVSILVHPVMEQMFYSGFVVQALLRKYNPYLTIYLAGILFAFLHVTFDLGTFAIGFIAAYLYFLTGSILAPLIFQVCCHAAGAALAAFYPRLMTLTGFLF